MYQKWKRIGRGFLLAFIGFIGIALFILCLSNLSAENHLIGFACLAGAVLVLAVFGRLLTPYLSRLASKRQLLSLLGIALIAAGYGVWESALREQYGDQATEARLPADPGAANLSPTMPMSMDVKGVSHPILKAVSKVRLRDNDLMIGVFAYGKAQAYLRRSFTKGTATHVVNDMIGANPLTVTYCDRTDRTRVFTANQSGALEVSCGGWHSDQEMALLVGAQRYSQVSREIPLTDVPFVLMTWKEWREQYPDSAVYVGLEELTDLRMRWIIGLALLAVGLGVLERGQKAALLTENLQA